MRRIRKNYSFGVGFGRQSGSKKILTDFSVNIFLFRAKAS